MPMETRTTDAKARLSLPKRFANSTVLIEEIGDSELRIRKARVIPLDQLPFREEATPALSDRDRDRFLDLLARPPKPKAALRRAVRKHRKHHG